MEVYFDNSATTKPLEEVIEVMNTIMRENYANPSSLHRKGMDAEKAVSSARKVISGSLNALPEEIIFTSGGTEANNIAIKGAAEANARKGKHIITSAIEHPSVINIFKDLQKKGYDVDLVPVSEKGIIDIDKIEKLLRDDTILVSIMHVNNELGSVQPVEDISKIVKSKNKDILFHVDAVQSFCKIPFDVKKINADLVSVSAHKINGPKGVGAVYIKKGTKITPVFLGGGQERDMRSGTENVPGICGFAEAVELSLKDMTASYRHVTDLRNKFIGEITEKIPDFRVNSPEVPLSLPHILNMSFKGVRGEVLLHSLETEGIYISTGSACSSRKKVQSHVLKEIGLRDGEAEGAVRVSFSRFNTIEEVVYATEKFAEIIPKLRKYTRR